MVVVPGEMESEVCITALAKKKKNELDVDRRTMIGSKPKCLKTRPDTRPISVADGWAGAEMLVFPLFYSSVTDQPINQPTNQPTNRPTDGRTKPLIESLVRD